MMDVREEFEEYRHRNHILQHRSRTIEKKYAFERESVPTESEYLEVKYSFTDPAVDPDFTGRTIEAVFGTTTNALELFLIERNIKGPCWLDVKAPIPLETGFSWCKVQVGFFLIGLLLFIFLSFLIQYNFKQNYTSQNFLFTDNYFSSI